jgi:hypothetical protein
MQELNKLFPQSSKLLFTLPNGGHLYVAKNEAGGYTYYSDEIGGGVVVWDTCLVDEGTLLAGICVDKEERYKKVIEKRNEK